MKSLPSIQVIKTLVQVILSKSKNLILVCLGLICLVLGIVGYVMPGLPGTIWLIIAATLFVRSSDRLYHFVIQNKLFGQQVREFLETGSMRRRAKLLSLGSMWFFSIISVLFAPYDWMFDVPVIILALMGTGYIISRPTLD